MNVEARTFCQNYFELFGLPTAFRIDSNRLNENHKALQKEIHPDRFVGRSEQEQRLAVQYAAFLNEAFTTLKSSLRRAQYLLKLKGRELNIERYTVRDTSFLMQQMHWREQLEELAMSANPLKIIENLQEEVEVLLGASYQQFEKAYDAGDLILAEEALHKMYFADKFDSELEAAYDKWDQ